jgi:hypothetical protein
MGQHKQVKLRGGVVRTADEYKASMDGVEKPKQISVREMEWRRQRAMRERLGVDRLMGGMRHDLLP